MRVLLFGISDKKIAHSEITPKISDTYNKCIIYDECLNDDPEEAVYCSEFRAYDLIVVKFNPKYLASYYEIIKNIKYYYESKVQITFLIEQEYLKSYHFTDFKYECFNRFQSTDIEIIEDPILNTKENIIKTISSKIERYFLHELRFRNILVDASSKTVTMETRDGSITFKIPKNLDFKVLSYFLRHYGETVSVEGLLNAISADPEFDKDSLIGCSIASIRQMFKSAFGINPIKSHKKVGYTFSMNGDFSDV